MDKGVKFGMSGWPTHTPANDRHPQKELDLDECVRHQEHLHQHLQHHIRHPVRCQIAQDKEDNDVRVEAKNVALYK